MISIHLCVIKLFSKILENNEISLETPTNNVYAKICMVVVHNITIDNSIMPLNVFL